MAVKLSVQESLPSRSRRRLLISLNEPEASVLCRGTARSNGPPACSARSFSLARRYWPGFSFLKLGTSPTGLGFILRDGAKQCPLWPS